MCVRFHENGKDVESPSHLRIVNKSETKLDHGGRGESHSGEGCYLPFMMSAKSSQCGFDVLCPSHGGSEHLGQRWEPVVNCDRTQDTFVAMVQGRKSAAFVLLDGS